MSGPVASIGVAVVPDATDFWRKFEAKVLPQAGREGEQTGRQFMRGFEAATRDPAEIKVKIDTNRAAAEVAKLRAQIAAMGATEIHTAQDSQRAMDRRTSSYGGFFKTLLKWAALVGPALIPIGGVAAAGLAAIGPAAATAALGIKGLQEEYKAGQFRGTEFETTIKSLQGEYNTLKRITAAPLAAGLTTALKDTKAQLPVINAQFQHWGQTLGVVTADTLPALANTMIMLDPLFNAISADLVKGAGAFLRWSKNSDALTGFVSYVQANMPRVLSTLGNLVEAIGHIFSAAAPYGEAVMRVIDGVSRAIKAVPTALLAPLVSGALAVYAAFRAWMFIERITGNIGNAVNKVKAAMTTATAAIGASAAEQEAINIQLAASAKVTALQVAEARAAMSRAAAKHAVDEAAAAEAAGAADTAFTELVARNAVEVAAIRDAEAAAAKRAATTSLETAAAGATGGGLGTLGKLGKAFSSAIGPVAALGIGITLLSGLFHKNSDAAQQNQKAIDNYAQSMQKSTDAMSSANLTATEQNLKADKATDSLRKLQSAGNLVGVSQAQMVVAVNQGGKAYDDLIASLDGTIKKYNDLSDAAIQADPAKLNPHIQDQVQGYQDQISAARGLEGALKNLRSAFTDQQKEQIAYLELQRQVALVTAGGATAAARQAAALHETVPAYLDSMTAAQQSTSQTNTQTQAFQAENDAASLLQQALNGLAGSSLSLSEANDSLHKATNTVVTDMAKGHNAIKGYSDEALTNRDNINSAARAAQTYAEAIGKSTKSGDLAVASYKSQKNALLDQIKAHGELTPAIRRYVNDMFDVKDVQDYISKHPTVFDANTGKATTKIHDLQTLARSIKQGKVPGIDVDTSRGRALLAQIQSMINNLRDKTVTVKVVHDTVNVQHVARSGVIVEKTEGGYISGPGTGTSDSIPAWLSNGEFVVNAKATAANLSVLRSINSGIRRYASGGPVVTEGSRAVGTGKNRKKEPTWTIDGHIYTTALATINAYNAMVKGLHKTALHLQVTVDRTDYNRFVGSMKKDASTISDAYWTMLNHLKSAGVDKGFVTRVGAQEKTLMADIAKRDKATTQLATATSHLADVQKTYNDQVSTAKAATLGGFDITQAGTGAYEGQRASAASIIAQQTQATAQAQAEQAAVTALIRKGLSGAYVRQLAGAGLSALPQLQALAGATSGQIATLNKQYAAMSKAGGAVGTGVANYLYGRSLTTAKGLVYGTKATGAKQSDLTALANTLYGKNAPASKYLTEGLSKYAKDSQTTVTNLGNKIGTEMKNAMDRLAKRPVVLIANDRELARAVASGEKKNKRR